MSQPEFLMGNYLLKNKKTGKEDFKNKLERLQLELHLAK